MLSDDPDLNLSGGVSRSADRISETFPAFKSLWDIDVEADVIIDFSTAAAVDGLLDYVEKTLTPVVLCTTGLSDIQKERIKEVSKKAPIFSSANMSLGINLIAELLKKAAPVLNKAGFDIEISERHHNLKIDAPSGTAVLLADAINESLDNGLEYVYDRSQKREKRSKKEIGFQSLRGGTIVGEHDVVFAGLDEVIEFRHAAFSKEVFGTGAVNAAKFLYNKKPGLYSMSDLLSDYL
jgi:4-hydroxy-tetrahydrodipicolinate reductase